jgi:hypothetical protein
MPLKFIILLLSLLKLFEMKKYGVAIMKLKMSFMCAQYNSFGIRQVLNTLSFRKDYFLKYHLHTVLLAIYFTPTVLTPQQ